MFSLLQTSQNKYVLWSLIHDSNHFYNYVYIEGEDYEEFTIDLRLRKSGPQRRCVGIVILEDFVAEEDETFQVVIKGLYDFTTITIRDDGML